MQNHHVIPQEVLDRLESDLSKIGWTRAVNDAATIGLADHVGYTAAHRGCNKSVEYAVLTILERPASEAQKFEAMSNFVKGLRTALGPGGDLMAIRPFGQKARCRDHIQDFHIGYAREL